MRKRSQLALLLLISSVAALAWCLMPNPDLQTALIMMALTFVLWTAIERFWLQPMRRQSAALNQLVLAWQDQDYATTIAMPKDPSLGDLTQTLNQLGEVLRKERRSVVQREQLLDSVLRNSTSALLMLDARERIILSNPAANTLLQRRDLLGLSLTDVLESLPVELQMACQQDGEYVVTSQVDEPEQYLVSRRRFSLESQPRTLLVVRELTQPLARSEVRIFKEALRVLSHELNNALSSISSLSHSAQQFSARGQVTKTQELLALMQQRAQQLAVFLAKYARIAKLPKPQCAQVVWREFLERVLTLAGIGVIQCCNTDAIGWFDATQLEQVLLNMIKNSVEAGSEASGIELSLTQHSGWDFLELRDQGSGMSEATMGQALMPFFSTKRIANDAQNAGGSGIGLAFAREVIEAHGGSITLSSNQPRGICVRLRLPSQAS